MESNLSCRMGFCSCICGFIFVILFANIPECAAIYHAHVSGIAPSSPSDSAPIYQSPIQATVFQEELFVFVPGSRMDTQAKWKNRYSCGNFEVTASINGTTLELGIQLTPNTSITNALCYIQPINHAHVKFNVSSDDIVAYNATAYNETCSGSSIATTPVVIGGEISCLVTEYRGVVYSTTYKLNESEIFLIYTAVCGQLKYGTYLLNDSCPPKLPVSCAGNHLSIFSLYPSEGVFSYVSSILEIQAQISNLEDCGASIVYTWRVVRMNPEPTPFTEFAKPISNNIHFPAQTLEQGTYLVILEIETFGNTSFGPDNYTHDEGYIKVKVMLPELIADIKGASSVDYPHGEIITIDASLSRDPVTMVTNDTDELTSQWTVFSFNSAISTDDFSVCVLFSFPNCTILDDLDTPNITQYQVNNQSKVLEMNTSLIMDTMAMAIFTISRGNRISSAVHGIHLIPQAPKITLSCHYNCRPTRLNKITNDRLELSVSIDWGGRTDITDVEYQWSASLWNTTRRTSSPVNIHSENGLNSGRIHITKDSLQEGGTYAIIFNVTATSEGGRVNSYYVEYVRTVNYRPYNGTCEIAKLSGISTMDTFRILCYYWMDEGDRLKNDSHLDTEPILTYIVVQSNTGVAVETETLLISSIGNMTIPVKEGDPASNYSTLLQVRVTDMYGDFEVVDFTVESLPQIDKLSITADRSGAIIVSDFMAEVSYTLARKVTSAPDVVLAYASSAASQLQTIPIPVKKAAVLKTLDSEPGVVLDLDIYEPLDEEGIGFQEYITNSLNTTVDPATREIQQGLELLSQYVSDVIYTRVVSGQKSNDQSYLTRVTQCLTNMIYVRDYTTRKTTNLVVDGLAILTKYSGNLWKIDTDATAEKEAGVNELVSMTSQTVTAVVPDELNQARLIYGMEAARRGLEDMIVITGGNISDVIDNSEMSPNERAYLYLKVQQQLKLELETSKPLAESSAHSMLDVTRHILASTELCVSCTKNIGTGSYFQTLIRDNATALANRRLSSGGTSVKLDSLADQGDQMYSASIVHLDKNVFMYDDDSASSQVAYGVIHIDIGVKKVTQDLVTYEQIVQSVERELITPTVFEEDVSKFSLHKFIYRSSSDDICIQVEPIDDTVTEYNVYIGKHRAPTISTHDIHVTATALTDWIGCILATQMGGHTGMTYVGLQVFSHLSENTTGHSSRVKRDVIISEYPSYYFSVVTAACMNWEEYRKAWNTNKCNLTWLPRENRISCMCRHISDLTFGTSFILAPNAIDFSTVFLRFSPQNQAAVIATLVVVICVYALAILWARRQDKTDIIRWGVTPLADNFSADDFYYILKVHTGFRFGSGTESRIAFILSGDKRDTGVRELRDDMRKRLPTGSVMQFLLSTSGHLGLLTHLRIWHDNSGKGDLASWYLSKVDVLDIQLNQSYTFISERWISVEKASDSMECLLTAAGHQDLQAFDYRFSNQAKNRIAEGHIWASIVYRPSFSNFTRVQRVTCALMYVMVTMAANAMYYGSAEEYETAAEFRIGLIRLSLQQLLVSVVCATITTPSTLLAVLIFQHARRQVNVVDHYQDTEGDTHWFPCWTRRHDPSKDNQLLDIQTNDSQYSKRRSYSSVLSLDIDCETMSLDSMRTESHKTLNKSICENSISGYMHKTNIPTSGKGKEDRDIKQLKKNIVGKNPEDVCTGNVKPTDNPSNDDDTERIESGNHQNVHSQSGDIQIVDIENDIIESTDVSNDEKMSDHVGNESIHGHVTSIENMENMNEKELRRFDILSSHTPTEMEPLKTLTKSRDGIILQIGATDIKFQIPHWCSYIGWVVVLSAIFTSALFVVLYSVEWGKQKSEEWLSTFCMSLMESAVFVDPVMILVIAFGMAIVFKTMDAKQAKYTTVVENYENIHDNSLEFGSFNNSTPKPPLKHDALEHAKRKRDTEVRWKKTSVDLIINSFFLWVLLSVSYSNRDGGSYYIHRAIGNSVMLNNGKAMFKNISNTARFFNWTLYTAVPAIFPDKDITGASMHWSLREYITGLANYRLGPPRLRQLRRKPEPCYIPNIETEECYRQYTMFSEDTDDYCVGWTNPPCSLDESLYNLSSTAWKYTPVDAIGGFPIFGHISTYGTGGYIANLDVNLNISMEVIKELYSRTWVDRKTRAVFLEFTVFNPNVNLFSYNMFMVEFPATGGAFSSFFIMPLRVYQHSGSLGSYILVCEILCIVYLIILLFQICHGFYTFRYNFYREFWLMFDCVRFATGTATVALYFARLVSATVVIERFRANKRNFVDFHHVALWDKMFMIVISFLAFMSVIRLLKTLEGNKNIYIIARVFSRAASDLLWFGILLVYVFFLFAVLGYSLFGSRLLYFMNIFKSVTTLFIALIGKNRYTEINETDPIMAKLFFFIFSLSISFIMFSIFLSSLCGCIQEVRENTKVNTATDVFAYAAVRFVHFCKGTQTTNSRNKVKPEVFV